MPAVPLSCGRSAAIACGRDSRAARRLASAWRITGSFFRASSKTPTRSLDCALPAMASRQARVTARFTAIPFGTASEAEARRPRRVDQRVDHGLEQAVGGPGALAHPADEARLHHRRFAHDHEQAAADG